MSLSKCLVAVLLLLSCSLAAADASTEERPCPDNQLLSEVQQQVAKLTAERDHALQKLGSADSLKQKALEAADTSKKAIDELSLKVKQLEAQLEQEAAKAEQLRAKLAQAQHAAVGGGKLQELLRIAEESWLPLWMQYRVMKVQQLVVAFLEDLKAGKHGPVGVSVHSILGAANEHATKAFMSVKPHMDKGYAAASMHAGKAFAAARPHVEDGLSKASVILEKAYIGVEAFWKKYITDASWLHGVKAQFSKVEAELIREVSKVMREVPALKSYSDPVTVQLLVYAVMLVPVLIILLPALALMCSRPASKESHKRKPSAGRPAAHGHSKRAKRA